MQETSHQVVEHTLKSAYLGRSMTLMVYLPPNYSPLYSYGLTLVQDGADYYKLGRLAKTLNQLIAENKINDTIACGIPYPDKYTRREWYHPEGSQFENYMKFLIYECLPFLQNSYSLEPLSRARTIGGDSLGATISLITAFKYPHTFGNVLAQSPMVDDHVEESVRSFQKGELMSVYHSIGTNETEVQTTDGETKDFYEPNRQLNRLMEDAGLSSYSFVENDGKHTWKAWQKELADALIFLTGKD